MIGTFMPRNQALRANAIHGAMALAIAVLFVAAPGAHGQAQPPVPQADVPLGRLFHTPQQRSELDKRRLSNVPVQEEAVPAVREALVTVNGYVARSGGKSTTWVNSVPQYDTVRSADPTRLPIEAADGKRQVKVGATLDTNRGDVRDVIGDGKITIKSGTQPR
jgi:hypothetical protein